MLEALTVDAAITIMLLMAIKVMYPGKRVSHLFLDNAHYHHAKLVQAGSPDQASLHPRILSSPQPDRTALEADAQARHPQPMSPEVRRFQRRHVGVPARRGTQNCAFHCRHDFRILV
jgi:hypothetical protein